MNANDAARSAATAAGSGNDINQNCDKLGQDIGKQQGDVSQAKARCSAALQKCQDACNPSDTDEKTEPGRSQESAQISQKLNECKSDISSKIAQLSAALAGLAKNAPQAAACKAQSDSGQPQQMQPPQNAQPQDQQQSGNEQKQALNCYGEEGARYSDCNAAYLARCQSDMSSLGCEAFASRYCGTAKPGTSANVGGSAHLVVDKSGEGLGSAFCKMVTAYNFCKAGGRGECPSCRGMYAYSSPACQNDPSKCLPFGVKDLKEAKIKCPSDPVFLDPNVLKLAEQKESGAGEQGDYPSERTAGSAGGGSGGSGIIYGPGGSGQGAVIGGAGGTGSGVGGALDGATPESRPIGSATAMTTGSGGGYSSQAARSESSEDDSSYRAPGSAGRGQTVLPAGPVAGLSADVSNQFGPNLFSIASTIYRDMCAKEKFTTCVRKKK